MIATIAEIDSDSIPAIVIVAIVGSHWDRWRSLAKYKFGFRMIVAIAEQFASECSEYSRFCHIINYLLTGLLVPYHEILSPRFLHTDLASSVGTSKPRA